MLDKRTSEKDATQQATHDLRQPRRDDSRTRGRVQERNAMVLLHLLEQAYICREMDAVTFTVDYNMGEPECEGNVKRLGTRHSQLRGQEQRPDLGGLYLNVERIGEMWG